MVRALYHSAGSSLRGGSKRSNTASGSPYRWPAKSGDGSAGAAVAVTALGPVGVDLEPAEAGDFDGLADVALTPRERLALRRLPSEQRSSAALT